MNKEKIIELEYKLLDLEAEKERAFRRLMFGNKLVIVGIVVIFSTLFFGSAFSVNESLKAIMVFVGTIILMLGFLLYLAEGVTYKRTKKEMLALKKELIRIKYDLHQVFH